MLSTINIFALSGLLIIITSALMALVMFFGSRNRPQILWGVFCVSVFLWGLGAFNIATSGEAVDALFWWRIAYGGVICIPVLFVHFVYLFVRKQEGRLVPALYLLTLFYLLANFTGETFIHEVHHMFGSLYYLSPTPLYSSFVFFFIALVIHSHILLYRAYRAETGSRRIQIEYFFVGSFVGFVGGSFSFYPVYGVEFYPYLNLAVALYPIIMGYAILKHRLLDLRVIMTELFIGMLWVFIFARILLATAESGERTANILLLLLSIVVGVFLIRSVLKEIRQREEIERLAGKLEATNASLEAANERLKELDQLKSEFVSLATHQIRGPITAIKGYASMLLEGDYGAVPEVCKGPVETILQSSSSLAGIVQDFLDVSRIEQGRMKYELTVFDLSKLSEDVARELMPNVEKKGLKLVLQIAPSMLVRADLGKMRQVIENLIDNAQKYTREGTITVSLQKNGRGNAELSVRDTGVGIKVETIPKLFQKFSRAEDASRANILGTGLGLYVARQLVGAQGGTIRAESAGAGKGSLFVVELPLK